MKVKISLLILETFYSANHVIGKFIDTRNFLLCESCHWCATSFANFMIPNTCPLCSNNHIESMPISVHESYRLAYDYIHGLTLEFWFDSTTVAR